MNFMSLLEFIALVIAVIGIVIAYQANRTALWLRQAVTLLQSLDNELFRVAQEQNPHYGCCTRCGRRSIVRHVVPREGKQEENAPDMFYCKPCWWLSSTVTMGDEQKYYKDRLKEEDARAAHLGPG